MMFAMINVAFILDMHNEVQLKSRGGGSLKHSAHMGR